MRSLIAIFLASIMFVSSVGFSLNKHYCSMSKETTYSLFGKQGCDCDSQTSCPIHKTKKKGCCDDEVEYVQLHENYNTPVEIDFQIVSLEIPMIYQWLLVQSNETDNDSPKFQNANHDPPPTVIEDIPVFCQSFLI